MFCEEDSSSVSVPIWPHVGKDPIPPVLDFRSKKAIVFVREQGNARDYEQDGSKQFSQLFSTANSDS